MFAATGVFGHLSSDFREINLFLISDAPGLLNPILFTSALCLLARNMRGFGFPSCGYLVTPPYSVHENPMADQAMSASAPLSKPAANPSGWWNIFPKTSIGTSGGLYRAFSMF